MNRCRPQNVMGFQLLPGAEVTLVVSKTSVRDIDYSQTALKH